MAKSTASLYPFACFVCRRSFKRPAGKRDDAVCPACGDRAIRLSRKFKPPPRADIEQWKKVEALVRLGFRFDTIYDGKGNQLRYPATQREIPGFVEQVAKIAAQQAATPMAEAASKARRARAQPQRGARVQQDPGVSKARRGRKS